MLLLAKSYYRQGLCKESLEYYRRVYNELIYYVSEPGYDFMAEALEGKYPMYAGMDGVKFKRAVLPGDTVNVKATLLVHRGPLFIVDAEASVDGQMCSRGKLTFMLIDKEKHS